METFKVGDWVKIVDGGVHHGRFAQVIWIYSPGHAVGLEFTFEGCSYKITFIKLSEIKKGYPPCEVGSAIYEQSEQ